MRTTRVCSVLSVVFVVSSLLIAGLLGNAVKMQQAIAANSTSLKSTNNNNNNHNGGALNVGPPEKMTIAGQSKPPELSPEKKLVLQQDQAKTHHSPELPISDQAIHGPMPGTQVQ
jgi:hypothetical protein